MTHMVYYQIVTFDYTIATL